MATLLFLEIRFFQRVRFLGGSCLLRSRVPVWGRFLDDAVLESYCSKVPGLNYVALQQKGSVDLGIYMRTTANNDFCSRSNKIIVF